MRYALTDSEWDTIQPILPNKSRGIPRVDDRRVLNGIFWVLGADETGDFVPTTDIRSVWIAGRDWRIAMPVKEPSTTSTLDLTGFGDRASMRDLERKINLEVDQ
jgi:hypothetical protein